MKLPKGWKEKKWYAYTIATCSAVILYLFLTHLNILFGAIGAFFRFISPVLWGIILAYIMDPLARLYERKLFRKEENQNHIFARRLSVVFAIVTILALLVLFFVALIPQLAQSVLGFVQHLDTYANEVSAFFDSLNQKTSSGNVDISWLTDIGNQLMSKVSSTLPEVTNNVLNTTYSVGTGFVNGVISFILAIYFMLDKERLLRGCGHALKAMTKPNRYDSITSFLSRCNRILIRYIVCDLLDGLIVGVANFIFFKIAGLPYSILISVVVGVTNLAPTFGPIAGGVIGAVILVLINPWYALWFLIFTLILQTMDGYVLKPKLFGNLLGVSSLWILISIIVGGRMFGVAGIMLAIPFAAIVDFIVRDYYLPWNARRKLEKERKETESMEPRT